MDKILGSYPKLRTWSLGLSIVHYNTIQYNTIQYNTIQYNTIQYNTIQYNTIQYNTMREHLLPKPQPKRLLARLKKLRNIFGTFLFIKKSFSLGLKLRTGLGVKSEEVEETWDVIPTPVLHYYNWRFHVRLPLNSKPPYGVYGIQHTAYSIAVNREDVMK